MTKHGLMGFVLALTLTILAACGGGTASPGNEYGGATPGNGTPPAGVDRNKLSRQLYFYNWNDYIDPDLLAQFEAEYGVRVIVDTYDSNEDMIAKLRAGNSGYDLVAPSDYAVTIMAAENLAAPLDKSLLPNLVHLDPDLLNQPFDPGNAISVPYFYGITGIAYNAKSFPAGIDSWAALFDPNMIAAYRGRFSMLDDERETPGAALRYLGHSLNETDPAILRQVEELLIAQKPYLAAYNSSDVNRKLASEEYILAHAWSGSALQARTGLEDEFTGNADIRFVIPKEGGMIWMDNLVIVGDSPSSYTAHVFINFLLDPEVAAQNAEWSGFLTPNQDALPLLSEEMQALYAEGFAPDDQVRQRLEWAVRNEQTAVFTDLWTAVKGR
ncbi:MAG: spermidine/putrescine ABC transporter substrate-binding protein [Oscillochloridaceae bacterium]|nr:spermidine/putrescine ABC transporter substrate-binding protein [Chloroflexaceae bacterium]MDW8390034.1 spermidine/putrescine ABC transporter substrate-binding protein [Oscillochloridaceae bacterium]